MPEAVAKQTRRAAGNRREFPICPALAHWLEPYRQSSGPIVSMSERRWRTDMASLFKAAGVRRIDNGLRKSAITYLIAANPTAGVILAAKYAGNSEAISRRFYDARLSEADGAAWFGIRRAEFRSQ